MTSASAPELRLNGVRYRCPDRPVVVVCNDGGDPAYIDRALKDGILPNVARFTKTGFRNALFRASPAPTTCRLSQAARHKRGSPQGPADSSAAG